MIPNRQRARDYLDRTPRSDFWEIVNEAKISDEDKAILDGKFLHGYSYQKIGDCVGLTEDGVKKRIAKIYDKVFELL